MGLDVRQKQTFHIGRKALAGSLLALLGLSVFNVAWATDLVAIVDLKFLRETDQTAAVLCFGDKDEDCVPWATHNLYRATIRKVIHGEESRKTVLVLFGRHAMKKISMRGVIATLSRLEPKNDTGAEYRVAEWGDKREFFCFRRWPDDTQGFELKADGEDSLTCYDAKPRDDDDE